MRGNRHRRVTVAVSERGMIGVRRPAKGEERMGDHFGLGPGAGPGLPLGAEDEPAYEPHRGEPIRVLVVDDHALFRRGLEIVLAEEPDIKVVGEAGDGAEAVLKAADLLPDIILMDVRMPRR